MNMRVGPEIRIRVDRRALTGFLVRKEQRTLLRSRPRSPNWNVKREG